MNSRLASGDILDLLSALVEKSLITVDERTGRYSMLETVRQYSRERLLDDESGPVVRERHLQAMFDMIASFGADDSVENATRAVERMGQELENLRSAVEFGLGSGKHRRVAKLLSAIHTYWFVVGSFSEPIGLFREALAPFPDEEMDADLAGALLDLGYCEMIQGLVSDARATLQRAAAVWARLGGSARMADCYRFLGGISLQEGNLEEAETNGRRALEASGGEDRGGRIAEYLGLIAMRRRDWVEAKRLLEQSVGVLDNMARVTCSLNLVTAYIATGDLESAKRELLWVLGVFGPMQGLFGLLHVFERVAIYAAARHEYIAAAAFLGQVAYLRRLTNRSEATDPQFEDCLALTKKSLARDEFKRQFEAGAALDPQSAAKLAQEFMEREGLRPVGPN